MQRFMKPEEIINEIDWTHFASVKNGSSGKLTIERIV